MDAQFISLGEPTVDATRLNAGGVRVVAAALGLMGTALQHVLLRGT